MDIPKYNAKVNIIKMNSLSEATNSMNSYTRQLHMGTVLNYGLNGDYSHGVV
jgi:hypothetical protein